MEREWIISETDLGCDGAYYSYTEVVRCKDCKHFELNHWDGIIITAHEICSKWGSGCKTDKDGYCFLGERKTDG